MKSRSNSVRRARPLLGTIVEIEVGGVNEREAHEAITAAFATVEEVQRRMSFHEPASMLSRLNRLAAFEALRVDEWTFEVLQFAAEVHRVSGGLFDATVAPALQARGFLPAAGGRSSCDAVVRAAGRTPGVAGAPPSNRACFKAGRLTTFADLQLLPDRSVRFRRPDLRIDLGGIAKGYAVDRAVATLKEFGVPRGLVNAGGDLRAFGDHAFATAIRHPENPGAALAAFDLRDSSLATSAHYFADRQVAGATLAPIIDPRTGGCAQAVRSATVRARTAMAADALTKVVMLAGEAALPVLEHFAADAIFVAEGGRALCSLGFHAALELSA